MALDLRRKTVVPNHDPDLRVLAVEFSEHLVHDGVYEYEFFELPIVAWMIDDIGQSSGIDHLASTPITTIGNPYDKFDGSSSMWVFLDRRTNLCWHHKVVVESKKSAAMKQMKAMVMRNLGIKKAKPFSLKL